MSDPAWTASDAAVLTILGTSGDAATLDRLLLRSDGLAAVTYDELELALQRLIGDGLVLHVEDRFLVSADGRTVAASGFGRYFPDLFEETHRALLARGRPPSSPAPVLSREAFDVAKAHVAFIRAIRRLRPGTHGRAKWFEWDDAPPLSFADCVEFLVFSERRHVAVSVSRRSEVTTCRGVLGPPRLAADPAGDGPGVLTFPVTAAEPGDADGAITLPRDVFETASYSSFDGADYFKLEIRLGDAHVVHVGDA